MNIRKWWKSSQLIDVGVEYPVDEPNAWTLVRVLVGKLDVNLPQAASKRRWSLVRWSASFVPLVHTVAYSLLAP